MKKKGAFTTANADTLISTYGDTQLLSNAEFAELYSIVLSYNVSTVSLTKIASVINQRLFFFCTHTQKK